MGTNFYPNNSTAGAPQRILSQCARSWSETTGNSGLSWYAGGLAVGTSNVVGSQDPSP
jgi:hypothetical protein